MTAPLQQARALPALVFFGLGWALVIPLTKIAVSTGHPPIGLILWQLIIAASLLCIFLMVRQRRVKGILRMDREALGYYLAIALLGTIVPNSFSYLAAAQLPAGIMAIVIASVPMFSMLIALTIRLERFSAVRLLGVLLGGAAVVVLIGPEASLPEPDKAIFVLVALVAPFCYGLEGNFISFRTSPVIDAISALAGASLIGALLCLPVVLLGGYWVDLGLPWGDAEKAMVISAFLHALTYTGYIWLVGVTSAVFASQIAYVVTLGGVLTSAMILSERYSWWVVLALLLMLAGLILVQPKAKSTTISTAE